jgi:hypothetical protein
LSFTNVVDVAADALFVRHEGENRMAKTWVVAVVAAAWLPACSRAPNPSAHRMEIRTVTGNTVQFIPAADQLPYCLIYAETEKGVTRQMTLPRSNQSVVCPAGEPVLGLRFRLPSNEGRVRVYVLFSDMRLAASDVAAQVVEMANPAFKPMDLRLPGRVVLETLDFIPTEESAVVVGEVVRPGPPDGGGLLGAH